MKRFAYQGLGSILVGLLLCGCASTGQLEFSQAPAVSAKRFAALQSAAPPVGAMQFCAADPERCGAQAAAYFQGKPGAISPVAVGGIDDSGSRADARNEAFRYMLAARRNSEARLKQAEAEGVIFVSAAKSVQVALNEELWAQLKDVQNTINRTLRPATDQEIYGKEEVWALPLLSWSLKGAPRGDCEDFALEKRARLLDLGWAPEALSIMVVDAPRIGAHAVLVVSTDRGEFVLDNLEYEPVLAETLPYTWVSRQSGLDLLAWTQTRLTEEAPPTPAADPMPETVFAGLLQERIKRLRAEQEADAQMAASIVVLPAKSENLSIAAAFGIELAAWDLAAPVEAELDVMAVIWAADESFVADESPSEAPIPALVAQAQTPEPSFSHEQPQEEAIAESKSSALSV